MLSEPLDLITFLKSAAFRPKVFFSLDGAREETEPLAVRKGSTKPRPAWVRCRSITGLTVLSACVFAGYSGEAWAQPQDARSTGSVDYTVKVGGNPLRNGLWANYYEQKHSKSTSHKSSSKSTSHKSASSKSTSHKVARNVRHHSQHHASEGIEIPRYPTGPSLLDQTVALSVGPGHYVWKRGIVTTIFWIGERPAGHNPVPNARSSWDRYWYYNYGGYDNPDTGARRNFIPVKFVPRQNPFYFALPYNDVQGGHTKYEARRVIPWFKQAFVRDGHSVLKDRWIAVRHGNRVCYAQWEDCGPFRTDDWRYVFGEERPRPNLNEGAGLDVSPAVRDYLGLGVKDPCDWKFVEFREVPRGPWTAYGDNNTFVILGRRNSQRLVRE
jgi:hypothetical protein